MSVNETRRLPPGTIEMARSVLRALRVLSDYAPINPAASVASLSEREQELREAEDAEALLRNALLAASDRVIAAGWALHKGTQIAKHSVRSQYGPDSDAVQSIGLKKQYDYRRPQRRAPRVAKG